MIDYSKHRAAIEKLYEDRATISRQTKVKVNGETVLQPVEVYADQPCRLSQKQLGTDGQTEPQNDIRYDSKLFIAPELEIKQGDTIAVTRAATGRSETYTAGEPFPPYRTHQELLLRREGYA
ncbi:MAG: transporter ATP-binding protein [Paenibacillus sp.]|nr:transporter ATP-binding protein [Paenibacillus sp.]